MWTDLGGWLYGDVWPNIFASGVCVIIGSVTGWFWKIKPHLKAQRLHREAEAAHREQVTTQLAELHQAVNDG